MGLFEKKKKACPVCGGELKFLSSLSVADGEICESCEKMIRGKFDIEEYWEKRIGRDGFRREDYKLKRTDSLQEMTVEDIRDMVTTMKAEQAEIMENIGSEYANVARAGNCFTIAPKALEVGLKRAKAYKDKYVATSEIISGEFSKGDTVTVTTDGQNLSTQILDVIECSNSSTFETMLAANSHEHTVNAGTSAWILLDLSEGVKEGSLIQK